MTRTGFNGLTKREIAALAALFVLTLPAVTARLYSSDEVQYYAYLRSLWFDHDVSFENEYRHFYDRGVARTPGFEQTFLVPRTPTGLRESFATIGSALLWAPFYGIADLSVRAANTLGGRTPADGYSQPYIAAVAYGSAVYGFLALLLSIGAARRLTGAGLAAGLAVWLGTPLLFYMYAAPPFSHACSAFAVALFVTIWLRVRGAWTARGVVALGLAAALMTMVREQDVFYALGPAVDYALAFAASGAWRSRPSGRRIVLSWIGAALAGAGAFVAGCLPQLLAYMALNGRPGPSTLVTRKMSWISPHAPGVLASPQHGLFAWTPLAILAVAGLVMLWAWQRRTGGTRAADKHPAAGVPGTPAGLRFARTDSERAALVLLLMFALQVYVSGSVESWTVAGAFGQRRFVGATVLLVIGLAAFSRLLPRGPVRAVAALAVLAAVWWNVGLMALFGAGLMDRQRLTLSRNAYDVFVTLPREAPQLAYRYFADRASFFEQAGG